MLYVGAKVVVEDAEKMLYNSFLDFHREHGYLIVSDIFENGNVQLTDNIGAYINFSECTLSIIKDNNILKVLDEKKRIKARTEREIAMLEHYINKSWSVCDLGKLLAMDSENR